MIRSDNGTNFVLGKNLIDADVKAAIKEGQKLVLEQFKDSHLSWVQSNEQELQGLKWKFMQPRAPHFGGLHKAAVKSVKKAFKENAGNTLLTYEGLSTVLAQIEAQLNSRPLLLNPVTNIILTPGHFLIGRPMNVLPGADFKTTTLTNLYKYQQQLQQQFWKNWQTEYLHELQQRKKWGKKNPQH